MTRGSVWACRLLTYGFDLLDSVCLTEYLLGQRLEGQCLEGYLGGQRLEGQRLEGYLGGHRLEGASMRQCWKGALGVNL